MIDDPTSRFRHLVAAHGPELPLDDAALLIAAHALPGLDLAEQRARLDEIAGGVRAPTLDAVRVRLVEDLGFVGDHTTYHDARNSLVPEVLDRRTGIPLTLAVVAIEVGRRAGVPLAGVGMPGHFLLGSTEGPDRFVDLFDHGTVLDRSGARAIFDRVNAGAMWDDRYLDPVDNGAIVTRMLANLANAYRRSGDGTALAWSIELRLALPGATDRDRRELAVLHRAAGRYHAAAAVLESTGQARDRDAAARLRARLN